MAEDTFIEPRASEEPYTRIKTLGRGAFGEAVLYRKTEDNVLVVVKEVNLSRASEKERADAEKEVDILSLLNHTNIVTYYNHYIDGTSLLIEMEYCNGGTLNDKIHAQKELFAEEIVIWYFFQICSGMSHIHDCDIVHRDIKTLNIFLTKSGLVKLGDFGIATILKGSKDMAESVVGTPYYMSPEIIQGQKYNQKSDMWALGCVLYEMLTLKKVFDATNPLRLVSDIVKGQFTDISPRYTAEMNSLVNVLLSQNPDDRPSIDAVLAMPLLSNLGREMEKKVWELNASTRRTRLVTSSSIDAVPVITSKTSDVFYWGGGKQTPQKVDMFQGGHSALQLAVGQSHFAVVTVENELFTWAVSIHTRREITKFETFAVHNVGKRSYNIGRDLENPLDDIDRNFTDKIMPIIGFFFCTEDGVLYTFGSDYWGCIGCNNELDEDVTLPFRVDFFAGNPVAEVACGECHIVVITVSKEVYSWGCGEYGRLGLGNEDDCAAPQKVNIPAQCKVLAVCCGTDFTFLLTTAGRLLGFGNNEENQLGMNTPQSLRKRQIKSTTGHLPYVTSPKPVMSFNKYSISSVAAGRSHSAVIDGKFEGCNDSLDNQIYSWGRGDNGRLGVLTDSLMRAKGGIPCTAVPRPIFGALHILSCIACTHWNSIIIAERVLSSRTVKRGGAQGRSLESQSSGDNAPDSEFLDPIRLDTNQDSDNLFGDLTKDSGVGRSPRAPGFGSDPRSQEESSMPPAWLQDELDQAEYISMGSVGSESSERSLSGSGQTLSTSESSVPGWLKNELRDAEYIPIGGLTPPAGRDSKYETSTSSVAVQCDLEPRDVEDMKTLLLQVQQENAKLRETLAQQNKEMKILQQENNNFVVNQRKFWELIDSWHKDCQQPMPLGLADPRVWRQARVSGCT
ncbi:PREDICTED: serine/threonine-protein kinase Nek9-like [Acropora digitifera]|uniref:serine/threonine-protein kinase Nek9-like n=1 Tax=Acropora digitifera TaxID=70779 RepID=UPI00077AAAAC|nr:PREDICTED: serine/threonine-protein kinase Nek9-like [Acropora digitifera]